MVVLIIGILAAIAVPKYQKAVRRAKAAEYAVWVKRIVDAEQEYFMANGRYTGNIEKLDLDYKNKWPNVTFVGDAQSKTPNISMHMWTNTSGSIFRVLVGEPVTRVGIDAGGYGAVFDLNHPEQNDSLACAEYACYGVPAGSFCKEVMGCKGEPFLDQDCIRVYKLP